MKYEDIFPDTFSGFIFVLYMALFINQGLIVTASQQNDKTYNYSPTVVVLLTEFMKLIFTLALYIRSEKCQIILKTLKENMKLCMCYMVPAFLYCLYNNLTFLNLSQFDPTTYFILLQLRVLITGSLFQFLFKKYLTSKQWISLVILTIGCIVKNFSTPEKTSKVSVSDHIDASQFFNRFFSSGTFLILLQVFCSCLAGVYNEKLLKHIGPGVGTLAQNTYMCVDSILFNLMALILGENLSVVFSHKTVTQILRINVIMIILNNAAIGIVTAFFLKSLNSIVKNYASALELIFTAVLSWVIFGIEIGIWTFISIFLVIFATFLYVQNPVVNVSSVSEKEETSKNGHANFSLPKKEYLLV